MNIPGYDYDPVKNRYFKKTSASSRTLDQPPIFSKATHSKNFPPKLSSKNDLSRPFCFTRDLLLRSLNTNLFCSGKERLFQSWISSSLKTSFPSAFLKKINYSHEDSFSINVCDYSVWSMRQSHLPLSFNGFSYASFFRVILMFYFYF